MAQLTIFLVLVVLVVVLLSGPTSQHQVGEQCWDTWRRCTLQSAHGTHTKWEECNLRCQCFGYRSGYCSRLNDCRWPQLPWKCTCMGKSDFYKLPTCFEKEDSFYE